MLINHLDIIKADSGWDTDYDSGGVWDSGYDYDSDWDSGSSWDSGYDGDYSSDGSGASFVFMIVVVVVSLIIDSARGNAFRLYYPRRSNFFRSKTYQSITRAEAIKIIPDFDIEDFNF